MVSNLGAPGLVLFINIILWIVGLLILYVVISIAVRDGINKSVIGQFIENKYRVNKTKNSFLDSDLDNEK